MASDSYFQKESYIRRFASGDKVDEVYDEWSGEYQKDILKCMKFSEMPIFDLLEKYSSRRNASILDVGAGTGLGGEELQRRGYTCIDAVDPSVKMLKIAEKKHIYIQKHVLLYESERFNVVQSDLYDCVMALGVIALNHLPADALPDLCRVLRPGGYLVITGNYEYWSQLPEYHVTMVGVLQRLVDDGAWEQVEWSVLDHYYTNDKETPDRGLMFIYRKL